MYTQCDSCYTVFHVTPQHLRVAGGRVCCCLCNSPFNALDSLCEELPPELTAEHYSKRTSSFTPLLAEPAALMDEPMQRQSIAADPEAEPPAAVAPPFPASEQEAMAEHDAADAAEWSADDLDTDPQDVDPAMDTGHVAGADALEAAETIAPEEADDPVSLADEPICAQDEAPSEDHSGSDAQRVRAEDAAADKSAARREPAAVPDIDSLVPGEDELPALTVEDLREFAPFEEPVLSAPPAPAARNWATVGWSAGIVLLLVVLLLQAAYAARVELARYPALRPLLAQLCAVTGCELPPRRAVDKIRILERRIVAHPSEENALLVEARIRNEAGFAQPFPQMRIAFFDHNGQVTAQRWFTPQEYLQEQVADDAQMPVASSVSVRLELVDPGEGSDNYELGFR